MHKPALARAQTVALVTAFVLMLPNLAPLPARALTVTASIPVGTTPVGVGVNPDTGRVYVANRGSNTVSVIDGATNTLIATIEDPAIPNGVAVNPRTDRIYVSNLGRSVAVIDGAANAVVAMIPVGSGAFSIAVNPETDRVYVANFNDRNVSVIDGATNSVIATIDLGGGALGIAFNPRTNRGYVANYQSGNVGVIDGATNTIAAVIPTGGTPASVAVNPETNRVYATASPQFTVIDGQTNAIITRFVVDGADDIAVNPTLNRLYATKLGVNRVAVIDGETNTEVGDVDLGTFPAGIDVSSRSNRVYVAKYFANAVAVITESDLTAPLITASVAPAPNASGWNNENVTLSWTVSDPDSGISSTSGCGPSTFTAGTEGTIATCRATNGDGLSTSRSTTIKIDKTAPTITLTATTASGDRYFPGTWTSQAVTVHYSCFDLRLPTVASSGLADCTSDQIFSAEGTVSTSGTATDNAGNTSSAPFGPIQIDRTPPTITATATMADGSPYLAGTWTNQTVTVHYDCADTTSGIVFCTGDQVVSYDGSADGTIAAGSAMDSARQTSSTTFGPILIDRTAPTIAFSGNAGTYEVDQAVSITCEARDTLSGIASTTCPTVAVGPATDYVGTSPITDVTLVATAVDNAGNSTSATTSFTVLVTSDGICRLTASLRHADTLCARATSIASAPNVMAKAGELRAFDNFLAAQEDVSADLAILLGRLARLV
jgi:YVTN family beta-propeller protein